MENKFLMWDRITDFHKAFVMRARTLLIQLNVCHFVLKYSLRRKKEATTATIMLLFHVMEDYHRIY